MTIESFIVIFFMAWAFKQMLDSQTRKIILEIGSIIEEIRKNR